MAEDDKAGLGRIVAGAAIYAAVDQYENKVIAENLGVRRGPWERGGFFVLSLLMVIAAVFVYGGILVDTKDTYEPPRYECVNIVGNPDYCRSIWPNK